MSAARVASQRERLQKFLSDAGVTSRRRAEDLIRAGRVLVNDRVVDELPAFVDPEQDRVIVDGARVHVQRHQYFLMHKPTGVVCTQRDPAGRRRAVDLLPELSVRLFPVGRLDADSSGLLLLTNDGELAQRVTHPRYGLPKIYRVEVRGLVEADLPARMRKGVFLSIGKVRADDVEVVHAARDRSVLQMTLREGRNRQVRRMLASFGHPVKKLKRVQIGPLSLKGLPLGACRRLSEAEVQRLRRAVTQGADKRISPSQKTSTAGVSRPKRSDSARRPELNKRTPRTQHGRDRPRSKPGGPRRRLIT